MNIARSLLNRADCTEDGQAAQNPLTKAIDSLLRGADMQQVDGYYGAPQEDMFEDAWEMAELRQQLPPTEEVWNTQHHNEWDKVWDQAPDTQADFEQLWANQEAPLNETTGAILDNLMMNPDPKFRNSEFFQFVQRLHTGQAKIVGNQLVENWEGLWDKQPQEQNFQQIWENSPVPDQLQQAWDASRQAAEDIEEEKLEKVWENLTPEEEKAFQQAWDGAEAGSGEMEEFVKMWQTMWPSEEIKNEYEFNVNNPYMDDENPMETAHAKIASGEVADAILALEAELTRNPETSEAWRLLGRLHADNDEDSKAIAALSRGFEIDPFNLDFLLNLGISCTNELEREQAIQHLKSWIQHSPDYQQLITDSTGNTIDDVRGLFEVASYLNPTDSNVHLALGVINFMVRDFDQAIAAFNKAVEANPQDATLWNKLGATLANSGKNSEALDAYHKALELKPNYVRAWVNLGIAYANIKDYSTAARFYLCALSLNPEAAHVWNYLTTSFVCMNRFDLVKKLEMRDPLVYKDEFDVITRADLPSSGPDWTNEFLHE